MAENVFLPPGAWLFLPLLPHWNKPVVLLVLSSFIPCVMAMVGPVCPIPAVSRAATVPLAAELLCPSGEAEEAPALPVTPCGAGTGEGKSGVRTPPELPGHRGGAGGEWEAAPGAGGNGLGWGESGIVCK